MLDWSERAPHTKIHLFCTKMKRHRDCKGSRSNQTRKIRTKKRKFEGNQHSFDEDTEPTSKSAEKLQKTVFSYFFLSKNFKHVFLKMTFFNAVTNFSRNLLDRLLSNFNHIFYSNFNYVSYKSYRWPWIFPEFLKLMYAWEKSLKFSINCRGDYSMTSIIHSKF